VISLPFKLRRTLRIQEPEHAGARAPARGVTERVVMLLENNPYPRDVRVRAEAETLVRAGHEVTVVAPSGPDQPRRECIAGVNVIRFRGIDGSEHGRLGFVLEYLIAAMALHAAALGALRRGATVLHLHNPPDIFFIAGWMYRLAGRSVVFDHHDLFPETVEVKFGPGPAVRVADWCQRLTFAVANHVIATNHSYASVARSKGAKRGDQVTVVRNAPPSSWVQLPLHGRPGKLDQVRLAYVGAISEQDGVDGLAPVLARLCDGAGPLDARLTIIGDGDARGALERALADHGVADRVTFAGWVAPEQVPQLLQDADVCVDPAPATDVNQRSTMIKIAEYLAVGKPVVSYDLLETRRTAGDAGVFVTPGDVDGFAHAIARIARDPELRRRLAEDGRRRASQLTWEHSEAALLQAYRALHRGGAHRRSAGARAVT
jgi:glycosyltransferase involved in cell wall biosynthesis